MVTTRYVLNIFNLKILTIVSVSGLASTYSKNDGFSLSRQYASNVDSSSSKSLNDEYFEKKMLPYNGSKYFSKR